MAEPNMTVIVVAFALYTIAIVAVGLYSARFAKRSDEDYFLAGRSLGPWVAALSASASAQSGWVTMGVVGLAFSKGYSSYWLIPGVCLGYIFNWFIMAARLRDRSADLDALTLPDIFSLHFRERLPVLRLLSVLVILVAMLLYVAAQFAAAGKAFDLVFQEHVDYRGGVIIGGVIVLLYTVIGGFRAACWTDFLQALIMIGALVGFPLYVMYTVGGYSFINEQFSAAAINPGTGSNLLGFFPQKTGFALLGFLFGSSGLGVNFGYPGQPHILVRYMALRDRKEAVIGGMVAVVWMFLVLWGAVTIGLLARAMAESGATGTEWGAVILADMASDNPQVLKETALLAAAVNMLPGAIAGFVLAAVLAAICSTADSQLVVAASSVANDVYTRLFKRGSDKANMWVNRTVVFLLGLGAVLMVIDKSNVNVYEAILTYAWAVLGAAFGPQLILLLFWKRNTYAGCVAGMLVGFILPIVWARTYTPNLSGDPTAIEIYNLPFSFMVALIVNVVVSMVTSKARDTSQV